MASDPASIWSQFCAELGRAGALLGRPDAPGDPVSGAEGLRYLARLTRAAMESIIESSDVDWPRLYQLSNETIKIGGDNPDTIYQNATISGERIYRIHGHRGSVPYLSFGTKANRFAVDGGMVSTGELEDAAIAFEPDGSFAIIASTEPQPENWLPMTTDTSLLLVRQTFLDRSVEQPAKIKLECLDPAEDRQPLSYEDISGKLTNVARFVNVTGGTFFDWAAMFRTHPNSFHAWDQSIFQKVGGDPNIHYLHAYWELQPDEAWVVETDVPDCRFWNFVLQNWWMESADYQRNSHAWITKATAQVSATGKVTIVVAARDPCVPNWVDTTGHTCGTALLRWISADEHPRPVCRVVKLTELAQTTGSRS